MEISFSGQAAANLVCGANEASGYKLCGEFSCGTDEPTLFASILTEC
jgi:hypothetical protein